VTDPDFDPGSPVTVSLDLVNPEALLGVLPQHAIVSRSAHGLVVRLDPYLAMEEPHPSSLESTFLVDYEDDAVRELISERPSGARPGLEELAAWVRETIEPSTNRGFDAASVIVKTRRGDCTEFAVLMAASPQFRLSGTSGVGSGDRRRRSFASGLRPCLGRDPRG
jgi:transglutaminase-like putative cysteine protease